MARELHAAAASTPGGTGGAWMAGGLHRTGTGLTPDAFALEKLMHMALDKASSRVYLVRRTAVEKNMDTSKMSKQELTALVARLQAQVDNSGDSGRIWPDCSKAVKEGKEKTSIMVLRGVHANPRNTVNIYPSQFARFLRQLPTIVEAVLVPALWDKLTFRSDTERASTKAFLTAYLAELKGTE